MQNMQKQIKEYLKNPTKKLRDKLILYYKPKAIGIAKNFAKSYRFLYEDLVSEALFILVQVISEAPNKMKDSNLETWISVQIWKNLKNFIKRKAVINKHTTLPEPQINGITINLDTLINDIGFTDLEIKIIKLKLEKYYDKDIPKILKIPYMTIRRKLKKIKEKINAYFS